MARSNRKYWKYLRKSSNRNFDDPKYVAWRQAVRKRDNYRCQWPGCVATKILHTHHIIRWADNHQLRYDVNNGITLCKAHHELIKDKEQSYMALFQNIVRLLNNFGK